MKRETYGTWSRQGVRGTVRAAPALALASVMGCAPAAEDDPARARSAPTQATSGTPSDTSPPGDSVSPHEDRRAMSDAADHEYVGLWVTADDHVRQRLLPSGRYVEARGGDESAYTGRYEIRGNQIDYWDDSGFTADGEFVDGVLHHGGMVMRRTD